MKIYRYTYPMCADDGSVSLSSELAGAVGRGHALVYRHEEVVESSDFETLWEQCENIDVRNDDRPVEPSGGRGEALDLRFAKIEDMMYYFTSERYPETDFCMPKKLAPGAVFDKVSLYPFEATGLDSGKRMLVRPRFEIYDYERMKAEYSPGQSIECVVLWTDTEKRMIFFHHRNYLMSMGFNYAIVNPPRYPHGKKIEVFLHKFENNKIIVRENESPMNGAGKLPDADLGLTEGQIYDVVPVKYHRMDMHDRVFLRYNGYRGMMYTTNYSDLILERNMPIGRPFKARLLKINNDFGLVWEPAEDWAIANYNYDKMKSYIDGRESFPAVVIKKTRECLQFNCGGMALILLGKNLCRPIDQYDPDTVVTLRVVSDDTTNRKMHFAEVCADKSPVATAGITHHPAGEQSPVQPASATAYAAATGEVVSGVVTSINDGFFVVDLGTGRGRLPLDAIDLSYVSNNAEILVGARLLVRIDRVDHQDATCILSYVPCTDTITDTIESGMTVGVHVLAKLPHALLFEWSGHRIGYILIEKVAATKDEYDSLDIASVTNLEILKHNQYGNKYHIAWKLADRALREYPFPEGMDTDNQPARFLMAYGDHAYFVVESNGWIVKEYLKNLGGKYKMFPSFARSMDHSQLQNLPVTITFRKNTGIYFGYKTEAAISYDIRDYGSLPYGERLSGVVIGEFEENAIEYYAVDLGDWLGAVPKDNFAWRMGDKELAVISERRPVEFYKMKWSVNGMAGLTRMGLDTVEMKPGESYEGTLELVDKGLVSVKLKNGYTVWCEYADLKKDTRLLSPHGDGRLMMKKTVSVVYQRYEIGKVCRLLAKYKP